MNNNQHDGFVRRDNAFSETFDSGRESAIENANTWLEQPVVYKDVDAYIARQIKHVEILRSDIKNYNCSPEEAKEYHQFYDGFREGLREIQRRNKHE